MTAEEAIKLINHICEGCKDLKLDTCDECVYPLAIKALEKQIPKKPIKKRHYEGISYYYCINCLNVVGEDFNGNGYKVKFCSECGTKQDWSDEE